MTLAMTINGQWGYQQQWIFSQYESNPKKCEGINTDIYIYIVYVYIYIIYAIWDPIVTWEANTESG